MQRKNWTTSTSDKKNRSSFAKPRHPPWLKGKEIGLYYRNLTAAGQPKEKKLKTEITVHLAIPASVTAELQNNLKNIEKIAKKSNITIAPVTKVNINSKCEEEINDKESNKSFDVKCDKSYNNIKQEPGTSATPDFISVNSENDKHITNERQLSLRGAGDYYKYGYMDIITGTFDEKLEECLAKGIKIKNETNDIIQLNNCLKDEHKAMLEKAGYKKLMKFREMLPTFKKSEELLDVINNNQVIVISGETGCGKSTQVPQLILDEAISNGRGGNVKILVTQPRRIAASSLAARVAEERAEKVGKSVGYAVRLERVEPRSRASILFCTTGVLLSDLEVNQGLTEYSHVILDEVHERDCHIDLALCMLKQVLKGRKDLKLILMSATIDSESLSTYFDNCKIMHIEGLAYPVKDVYLEDILQLLDIKPKQLQQTNQNWRNRRSKTAKENMEKGIQYWSEIGDWLEKKKRTLGRNVYETLKDPTIEDLNVDLILQLLIYICKQEPGAILVFLPGIGDITKLLRMINESKMFPSSLYEIYPLHSKLPSLEQRKIFERPPSGTRKIIIATNIAETSITIDDIVYVIDCAKMKITGLNVEDNVSTLKTEWISQANLRQRRGRAGRCQPGICYHLLTSFRAEKIDKRVLPELQRSDLLEPVLTIKRLRLGRAAVALNLVAAPPASKTIEWAVQHLQRCGALDENETLTPLGWHLARLPVHPAAGKLLLLGSLFGCLDRAASVAAVWSFKDPFMLVIGKEHEVDKAKLSLALGEPSDHVAIAEAIIQWEQQRSYQRKRSFAYDHFMSMHTTELLSDMKKQLGNNLKQMGFLPSGDVTSSYENRNKNNLSLFKAIVAAALYPNVANVRWTGLKRYKARTAPRAHAYTPEDGKVNIHPSSVMASKPRKAGNSPCDKPGANYLVYWLKQRSTNLFLIDVTLVHTLPLLFFGELKVSDCDESPDECLIPISNRMVRLARKEADLLFKLRSLLDQVLASKIMISSDHSVRHSEFDESVLNAVIELITAEDEGLDDYDSLHTDSDCSESDSRHSHYQKY